MNDFLPEGDLEVAMMKARAGFFPFADPLSLFLKVRILVPSAEKVAADGKWLHPLEFMKENLQMLGCFTSAKRIADFSIKTPFYLEITGVQLLQRLPEN